MQEDSRTRVWSCSRRAMRARREITTARPATARPTWTVNAGAVVEILKSGRHSGWQDWRTVTMMKRLVDQLIGGIVTALLFAVAAAAWQYVADGAIVRLLGGVTEARFTEARNLLQQSISDVEQSVPILDAAVVAFDSSDGCLNGWTPLSIAEGRMMLGAGPEYEYRTTGGEESVVLTERHMPAHAHPISQFEWGHSVNGGDGGPERLDVDNNEPSTRDYGKLVTDSVGAGDPHPNMPPYVALYFCKKE